uniref:Autophagy-related protein 13 n=1 Tax=Globodera rostochiensis TaxID=31243 RepID=A0A914HC02_GLORO
MTYNESSEFKEYSSFMRFFSSRMVQAVVQARMGKMLPHPCTPNPDQADYFNLVIDEIGEISAYLKSTIGKNYPPTSAIMTLEFILYTDDGDTLPLEAWVIRLDTECQDWPAHQSPWTSSARTTFYHQLSNILRSLIVASRFTPTYRHYVRQEHSSSHGSETFVITYRVFEGEPDLAQLGDEYKFKKTKMEIQPQPFVDEATMVQKVVNAVGNTPLMVAVPQEGSETVPISPISTGNINLFSTSPISQDLPFTSSNDGLGMSVPASRLRSSSDTDDQPQTESPRASNSFPQHLSAHNKVRMRNNSFPFASLLLESQSSTSQTLPKVPENDAVSDIAKDSIKYSKKGVHSLQSKFHSANELRRNSSLTMDNFGEANPKIVPFHCAGKVLFGCGEIDGIQQIGKDDETEKRLEDGESEAQSRGEEEEEEEEQSSDSSFVKVIAFADGISSDELGTDLCEFVKEVKLAPDDLRSFSSEPVVNLSRQLEDFRAKKFTFNKFVADVSQMEGEHSMVQEDER